MFSTLVLTLYPEMFPGPLSYGLAGRGLQEKLWNINAINIRDFAHDKHRTVDDTPYGGGPGMVLRADVLEAAYLHARTLLPEAEFIYFSPRGQAITQKKMHSLSQCSLIMLCGRFEGIDQRFLDIYQPLELSLGDFILSGGEIAAHALLDACVRLLPGIAGNEESLQEESFSLHSDFAGLLEYPHYTKPPVWKGKAVPEVLLSGNHAHIKRWRTEEAQAVTRTRRPDLLKDDEG